MYEFDPTVAPVHGDAHAVEGPRPALVANILAYLGADYLLNGGKVSKKLQDAYGNAGDTLFGNATQNEFRDVNQADFMPPDLLGQAYQSYGRQAPMAYEADPFAQPSLAQMYAQRQAPGGAGSGSGMFWGSAPAGTGTSIYSQGLQSPGMNMPNLGNAGATDSWQHRQLSLANLLQDRALGNNSVADMQFRASLGGLTAQQQALAASNRRNPGLAAYAAQANAGAGAASLSQAAAIARMQEAQAAQQQLGNLTSTARDQTQRLTLANQQALLDQQRLNDSRNLALQQLHQQGQQAYQGARGDRFEAISGVKTGQEKLNDSMIELGKMAAGGGSK